jgi:hypothetical protein
VELVRGVAVPSFPEPLRLEVTTPVAEGDDPGPAPEAPTVSIEARGASVSALRTPEQRRLPGSGWLHRWNLTVEVKALTAELAVVAETTEHLRGRWEGRLAVAPGGLWLAPADAASGQLEVRSATPRRFAFLSLLGASGRLWGASLRLHADESGYARAQLPLPPTLDEPRVAVLSSDPTESDGATVAWPLVADSPPLTPVRLQVLVDGMPATIDADRARATAARRPAYGLILAAGAFEVLFLLYRNRRTRNQLRQRMRRLAAASGEGGALEASVSRLAGSPGLLWLTVLAGGVALAFVVLAAVAAWG